MGEVTVNGDTLNVVFKRHYPFPIEKVWAALTIPERLADWFVNADVDLRVGGLIRFEGHGVLQQVQISTCEPPRVLAWVWAIAGRDTLVRFELTPEPGGCRLTLTHTDIPRAGSGVCAGWHAHLEGLGDALNGHPVPWDVKTAREARLNEDVYRSVAG
jgi:uncharacterized protein YndB with AHSA1/START domain